MKKTIWWVVIIIIVIIGTLFGFNSEKPERDPDEKIKIGVILPLTGPAASIAEDLVKTLELYEKNHAKNVELVVQDDACAGKGAVSAYNIMKNQGIRIYMVACSGSVLALAPLLAEDGNVILTGYSGSILIRDTGDEVIRFISDGLTFAERIIEEAKSNPDKRYALFHEIQDYPQSVGDKLMEGISDQILVREMYKGDNSTFKTHILKIRESGADEIIFVPVAEGATDIILKEMKDLGFNKGLLGEANVCDYSEKIVASGLGGVCFKASMDTEGYKEYIGLFNQEYNKEPFYPYYNATTFDVIDIIDNFLDDVGVIDDNVIAELKANVLDGVSGEINSYTFEPSGQVIGGDEIKRVEF